jgi:alpha-1,6-mannosyltransferase
MEFCAGKKLWLLGLLSAVVYGVNFHIGDFLLQLGIIDTALQPIKSYLVQVLPLGLLYLWGVRITARTEKASGSPLVPILLFAFLFRLPLIPSEGVLSTDIYRYLWEGKIQIAAGMNPYSHPPSDKRLVLLRDEAIYPHINRKEAPTIYPAGAQILFAAAHWLGADTPQELKALALAAEALTLVLLLLILRQLLLPLSQVIIYAWNPPLIYELFYSGHLEAFLLPPLLGFIYFFLRGKVVAGSAALGLAAAVKLVPVFLLATIPRERRLKAALPFILVIALSYTFYLDAGANIVGFLPSYFSDPLEVFNLGLLQLGLFTVTNRLALPAPWIRFVLLFLLVGVLVVVAYRPHKLPGDLVQKSYAVLSAYLFLIYPAFHPWYVIPLISLLCFVQSQAWICFSLLLPLSYLQYLAPDQVMPTWVTLVQYMPLYILLALECGGMKRLWKGAYLPGGVLTGESWFSGPRENRGERR